MYLRTSLIVSIGFAVIETFWRYPYSTTTIEQSLMNFFWAPFLIHGYEKIIDRYFLLNIQGVRIVKVILFPFNVWIAEIVQGNYLLNIHGYRVWYYSDNLSMFDGHITLSYYFYWLFLGVIVYLVFYSSILFSKSSISNVGTSGISCIVDVSSSR